MLVCRLVIAGVGAIAIAPGAALGDTLTVRLQTTAGVAVGGATAAAVASSACTPAAANRCAGVVRLGADGQGTIDDLVGGVTYTVTANLPGYGVARRIGLATGSTATVEIAPSANAFSALPVYGGANAAVYADGAPGVFYALGNQVPQLYRTTDWGGSWQPVSTGVDDAERGLAGLGPVLRASGVATSGFPGEIAAVVGANVYFSRDFGLSWKPMLATPPPTDAAAPARLDWGHAGATSVLVATVDDHQHVADMTADAPTFAPMTTDFARAADGRAFAVGNGIDAPYVAVADNSGTVTVSALTAATAPGAAVATASGFPGGATGPPLAVVFGGAAPAAGPPSSITVASASHVGATVKATGDAAYPAASVSAIACGTGGGAFASDSGMAAGEGIGALGSCWLAISAGTLTAGADPSARYAIDAGWGQSFDGQTSRVVLRTAARGPLKSTALGGGNVPVFDAGGSASAGVAAGTGGVSIAGITSASVADAAFGPSLPQLALVASPAAGAAGYASGDGGATMTLASATGGSAVEWFAGAGGSWLVFGTPPASSHVLTALHDWTAATPPAAAPNVAGAQAGDDSLLLSGSGLVTAQTVATALAGAPGTDLLFTGLSDAEGHGALRRVRLSPGPAASEPVRIGDGQITGAIQALAYCPAVGSASTVADVLLVATASGLWRVSAAAGAAPVAAPVSSVPGSPVHDVQPDCPSGRVWAGAGDAAASLYRSADGGQTFTAVTHSVSGTVHAIGVPPSEAGRGAVIAVGPAGALERTADDGGRWTLVNDPATGHSFAAPGITALLVAPGTGLRAFSGLVSGDVLMAGAGAFAARLPVAAGTGPVITGPDRTAPVVTRFAISRRRFAVASGRTARIAAKRGAVFSFRITERARARIALTHVTVGYRSGKRCVAKRPKRPRKPRYCTRYVPAGALVRRRVNGRVKIPFTGRMGNRRLKVGAYRALLTARDPAGNRSPVKTQHFRIVTG